MAYHGKATGLRKVTVQVHRELEGKLECSSSSVKRHNNSCTLMWDLKEMPGNFRDRDL